LPTIIQSRLHDAITVFGRFLRQAGCRVGTGEIMSAVEASSKIDPSNREDFRQALKACFITNHKMIPMFDQLFDLYWQNPDRIENVTDILRKLYESRMSQAEMQSMKDQIKELYHKRVEGFKERQKDSDGNDEEKSLDVFLYSPQEILREKRFDTYSDEELDQAMEFIKKWDWKFGERQLRRLEAGRKQVRLNIRQTIRKNIFPSQDFIELQWKKRKTKPRPLVILLDISGSMDMYTRILLHFIYTLHSYSRNVEAFTFGTRLSRITHYLNKKDVSDAMELVNDTVKDWSGGTRIGETLSSFNLLWGRRVLSGGAVILVISDGWDTGEVDKLDREMDRLHRSCHRLIWLNPNLGYEGFKPLTKGFEVIMPHLDDFLPIHNLNSLLDLGSALADLDKTKNRVSFGAVA